MRRLPVIASALAPDNRAEGLSAQLYQFYEIFGQWGEIFSVEWQKLRQIGTRDDRKWACELQKPQS
jgi:hypothetical protein